MKTGSFLPGRAVEWAGLGKEITMDTLFMLAVTLLGGEASPASPVRCPSASVSGERDTITKEQAVRIQKAARGVKKVANAAEEVAHRKSYAKTLFWADRLGDFADSLVDEAGDLIRDGGGNDDEVRHLLREIYGAYSNFRMAAMNLPEERDRRTLLKGSLKAYRELFEAICPMPTNQAKALLPPMPGPDDSD
jgi:hypothetical protein